MSFALFGARPQMRTKQIRFKQCEDLVILYFHIVFSVLHMVQFVSQFGDQTQKRRRHAHWAHLAKQMQKMNNNKKHKTHAANKMEGVLFAEADKGMQAHAFGTRSL